MKGPWEARLAAAVITSSFDDILAKPPNVASKRGPAHYREWKKAWINATEFLFTPECGPLRAFWFHLSGIPQPRDADAMRAAVDAYVAHRASGLDEADALESVAA